MKSTPPSRSPGSAGGEFSSARYAAALGVAVAFAWVAFAPALSNGFVWDDPLVLQQLRSIHSWRDLVHLPPIIPKFYYRPLIFVTYLLDARLGGGAPFWFHASVLGFHALNVVLVGVLARSLLGLDWVYAGCAATLFAVHPVHTESVAWMAGRSDVVVCGLLLLTVLLGRRRDSMGSALGAGAALFLGLCSKEMAVAGLVLVPLIDVLEARRLHTPRYVPLLIAAGLYFVLREQNIGAYVGGTPAGLDTPEAIRQVFAALGYYLRQTFLPVALSPYVPSVPEGPWLPLAGAVSLVAGAAAFGVGYRRGAGAPAFLLAWFFLTLAPSLAVLLRRSASAVLADRYLYVPSVAACLLATWALQSSQRRYRRGFAVAVAVTAVLAVFFAIQSRSYSQVWKDNLTFFEAAAQAAPTDPLPQRELGLALMERGRLQEAEGRLRAAAELPAPLEVRAITLSNLASLHRRQGRLEESAGRLDEAIRLAPHPGFYHNLGLTLMGLTEQAQRRGDSAEVTRQIVRARAAFERALAFEDDPRVATFLTQWEPAKSHALLGQVLFSLGERAAARGHLETSLKLQPNGPGAENTREYLKKFDR